MPGTAQGFLVLKKIVTFPTTVAYRSDWVSVKHLETILNVMDFLQVESTCVELNFISTQSSCLYCILYSPLVGNPFVLLQNPAGFGTVFPFNIV